MGIRDTIRTRLQRYILGDVMVGNLIGGGFGIGDTGMGGEREKFRPEDYTKYQATSNNYYAAATMRADQFALMPLRIYRLEQGGARIEDTDNKLAKLLRIVNKDWTFEQLIRTTELSLCTWGIAFWVIERGASGVMEPSEIWWARSPQVEVVPSSADYIGGYKIVPRHGGEPRPYSPDSVVAFRRPNLDNELEGLSDLAAARLAADIASAGAQSKLALFKNGLQMGGWIMPPEGTKWTKEQTDEAELLLSRRFKGVDKSHRWAFLRDRYMIQPNDVTPRDAEWLGTLNWSLEEVARALRVPIDLLGGERRTYENFETALKALWTLTILPEAAMIASEIVEQMFPMFGLDPARYTAEFDSSGVEILQEDRGEIIEQIKTLVGVGVPLNAALQELAPQLLPPGESGYPWGDVWWAPITLVPIRGASSAPPPSPGEGEEGAPRTRQLGGAVEYQSPEHVRLWRQYERRTRPWEARTASIVRDLFRRQRDSVLARLRNRSARGVEDAADNPFDQARWTRDFREEMRPIIAAIFAAFGEAGIDDLGLSDEQALLLSFEVDNQLAVQAIEARAQAFAREVNETTWEALRAEIAEGIAAGESTDEIADRVRDTFGRWMDVDPAVPEKLTRVQMIARTEVNGASNSGTMEGWRQSSVVVGKGWLSALISTTRDAHAAAHGQTVALNEPFEVGGEALMYPGDRAGSAGNVINCLCAMTSVIDTDAAAGELPLPQIG